MAQLVLENGRIDLSDGDRSFGLRIDRLALEAGQAVALTGQSGAGKTLLLEMLGLLRAPGAGTRYAFGDVDLAGLWRAGPRSRGLAEHRGALFGFVPQTGGLMPFLTVAENVALPQRVTGRMDDDRVRSLIDRLGLSDVAALMPAALSIGQRQRTAIARALAHGPPVVIADEPTAALDPETADRVLELFLETAEHSQAALILSSHDLDRVGRFGLSRWHLDTARDGNSVTSTLALVPC